MQKEGEPMKMKKEKIEKSYVLIVTEGLTERERKELMDTVRKIRRKRRHDNKPCLRYMISSNYGN